MSRTNMVAIDVSEDGHRYRVMIDTIRPPFTDAASMNVSFDIPCPERPGFVYTFYKEDLAGEDVMIFHPMNDTECLVLKSGLVLFAGNKGTLDDLLTREFGTPASDVSDVEGYTAQAQRDQFWLSELLKMSTKVYNAFGGAGL